MSTRIICAAIATLAVLSNTAEAGGFSHIPTVPRPVINTAPPSGPIRTTVIVTHPGNFTKDTRVFSDQSGKVVMAISSLTRKPAAAASSPSGNHPASGTATPGQGHNTSNSQNTTNSQNVSQAQQSHNGANCNVTLHKLRIC